MALKIFTLIHVLISLTSIASGLVVVFGLLTRCERGGWTKFFLATAALTSLTGFFFPFHGLTPGIVVGIISFGVLTVAVFARYAHHLAGAWRTIYAIGTVLALYLNVFVLVVQSFLKVPALKALAPTQSEPSFKLTQLMVLIVFLAIGTAAAIRFRQPATQTN